MSSLPDSTTKLHTLSWHATPIARSYVKQILHLESKIVFSLWLLFSFLPVLSLIYNYLLLCNLSALTVVGHLILWPLPILPSNHTLSLFYFLPCNPAPSGSLYPFMLPTPKRLPSAQTTLLSFTYLFPVFYWLSQSGCPFKTSNSLPGSSKVHLLKRYFIHFYAKDARSEALFLSGPH